MTRVQLPLSTCKKHQNCIIELRSRHRYIATVLRDNIVIAVTTCDISDQYGPLSG